MESSSQHRLRPSFTALPANPSVNVTTPSGDTFEQRADLPAAWAGLTDEALEAASGVKGAKFCHNARFIAVATTREAILEMARIAVQDVSDAL